MTLVSLPSPIPYPGIMATPYGSPGAATVATLDAAGEYVAYVFSAKEDMTVTHVGFYGGTATGSPQLIVGIEALSSTAFPDGSAGFGSTNSSSTATASGWNLIALGGTATIPKGSRFAVKIAYSSGTSQVIQNISNMGVPTGSILPYQVVNTGTPTKASMTNLAQLVVGSSSTTFYNLIGAMGASSFSTNSFNNTSSAKRGLRFVPPMNCRAVGIRWHNSTAFGDYNIVLTNDAGTELSNSSTAIDGDTTVSGNGGSTAYFDNAVMLTAGTAYRVWIEPSSATNCNISTLTLGSSDYFSATPAKSTAVATYCTFVSGPTITDSTTQIPLMDVLLDQVDDGAGSGGVVGVIGG